MTERTYPVPTLLYRQAQLRPDLSALVAGGQATWSVVNQLADSYWPVARVWARSVLDGECVADRTIRIALTAAGVQPDGCSYQGVLDPDYDAEVVIAVVREDGQRWTGTGWVPVQESLFDTVPLNMNTLGFTLDALARGSSGVVLRPTVPRAWLPQPGTVMAGAAATATNDVSQLFAVVDEFDTSAVLDLLQVVPGPLVNVRRDGVWVRDDAMLERLRGVDPPPVVAVDSAVTDAVLAQVDQFDAERAKKRSATTPVESQRTASTSLAAAVSTMPANLKAYWLTGKGALKIRWGVSGDFNRCVQQLRKYLRLDQVQGACATLHRDATDHYPGPGRGV